MNVNNLHSAEDEIPIVTIIQQLKDGVLDPKMLSKETRQQCVEVCILEGYSVSQITQLFHCSEKTVRRDIIDIRAKNALTPNVELVKQIIGELYSKGINHHGYLMRLARSKDASISEKVQAEYAAWKVLKDLSDALQSVGYLPMRPQEIVSDIYHHQEGGDSRTYEQLKQDLNDIERVARDTGTLDPKIENGIQLLQQRIEKAEIVKELTDLNKVKETNHNNKEDSNE